MAKKDDDPYGPVRKTDPYVSGGAYGNSGDDDDKNGNDNCMVAAVPIVVGIGLIGALAKMAIRGRRS